MLLLVRLTHMNICTLQEQLLPLPATTTTAAAAATASSSNAFHFFYRETARRQHVGRYDQHGRRRPRNGEEILKCPYFVFTARCITTTTYSSYYFPWPHPLFSSSSFYATSYIRLLQFLLLRALCLKRG